MKNKFFTLCLLATLSTACLMSSCKGKESNEPYVGYLFAYFNGNAPWQEQICFALSADGYNYTPLNDGNPIISSDTIANKRAVRDPHILRGEDGYFYMVVTDMRSSQGWASNDGLVLLRSNNLIDWTHSAIDFPTTWPERFDRDSLTQVWAPQTIYDPEAGKYMLYYAIGEIGQHYITYCPRCCTTTTPIPLMPTSYMTTVCTICSSRQRGKEMASRKLRQRHFAASGPPSTSTYNRAARP